MFDEMIIDTPSCWIIAYGNAQRGDKAIGSLVARLLRRHFGQVNDVGIRTLTYLDPSLLEEIQSADTLIFVNASMENLQHQVYWSSLQPELNGWAIGTNNLSPEVFLGLLQLLYNKRPSAWLVAVQGHCFDPGKPLSTPGFRNARTAALQIMDWLFRHNIALPHQLDKADI